MNARKLYPPTLGLTAVVLLASAVAGFVGAGSVAIALLALGVFGALAAFHLRTRHVLAKLQGLAARPVAQPVQLPEAIDVDALVERLESSTARTVASTESVVLGDLLTLRSRLNEALADPRQTPEA